MTWHKLAQNPQSLESLYETVPDLENVELFAINLERAGEQLQIRFDLPTFPDKPSSRWHKDFNTAQIRLSFWGITKFEGKGWQINMKVDIVMTERDRVVEVVIANPEIDLRYTFTSAHFYIEKISPYQKG